MLTSGEINIIGNIMNTSWGRSSTEPGSFPRGTASPAAIKGHLVTQAGPSLKLPPDVVKRERGTIPADVQETQLVITYTDFVSFRSDIEVQANIKMQRDIASKAVAVRVADLKKTFRGASGRALKMKMQQEHDSVESVYTPTPDISLVASPKIRPQVFRGYYRYVVIYTVS